MVFLGKMIGMINNYMTALRVWMSAHENNFFAGAIMAIFGYFAECKGIFVVMFAAIIIDLITGVWASRVEGKGIKSKQLWRTISKMALSFMIVALLFAIDKEIDFIQLHKVVAWIVIGFEVWSILENSVKITDHKVFRILKRFMEDKFKEQNIDLNEEKNK